MKLRSQVRFACRPAVLIYLSILFLTLVVEAIGAPKSAFEFHNGERVVLLGDTLIEREGAYGYIEERLTTQFPERNVQFRNLGWSADTPQGTARARFDFDKPGKGFEKLKNEVATAQPTVAFLGYGMGSFPEQPPATTGQVKESMLPL